MFAKNKKIIPGLSKSRLREFSLQPWMLLVGVLALALFLRLLYVCQVIETPVFYGLAADSETYDTFALQILKGNLSNKDFLYLNPLYVFFLFSVYSFCGYSREAVVFLQASLDAFSCVGIYYIAACLFNKKTGVLAACIYACYGMAIFYTGLLLVPTLVIFIMLLFVAALLFAEQQGRASLFFLPGILLGLASAGTPQVALLLALLPLWFFTVLKSHMPMRKRIVGLAGLLLGFFLVASVVTLRNSVIEKTFSPFSVLGGLNFYIGNNPQATGGFMMPEGMRNSPIDQFKTSLQYAGKETGKKLTPAQASQYWLRKGLRFIRDYPLDALALYIKKLFLFWRQDEISINIDYSFCKTLVPLLRLPFISFGAIAPLALPGIFLLLKRKNTRAFALFILVYMFSVIVFFVSDRYRLPVVPFLILCAAYFLCSFAEFVKARDMKKIIIFTALVAFLFLGINVNFKSLMPVPGPEQSINLGKAYIAMGKVDEALEELKKAVAADPHHAGARHSLGVAYEKKELLEEAIRQYAEALRIKPDFTAAHFNLGLAYEKKGDSARSIYHFTETLRMDSQHAGAHISLGRALGNQGRADEAIAVFEHALQVLSDTEAVAVAHANLAIAYYYKGAYRQALVHADRSGGLGGRVDPKLLEALKPYR